LGSFLDPFFYMRKMYATFYWSDTECPFKHWLTMLLNIRYSFSVLYSISGIQHIYILILIYILYHSWETLSLFTSFISMLSSFSSIEIWHLLFTQVFFLSGLINFYSGPSPPYMILSELALFLFFVLLCF